ncbi:hypothetical protein H2203_001097 [Taxawa tesnikishii (nom. ined.)]|nr:hypothetical protein H2203_001097 [Dothideales sp. JES 119]
MASFSYAQAAMGRTPSASSTKQSSTAVSGAATPSSNSVSELAPGSSWADDTEGHSSNSTVASKVVEPQIASSESSEKAGSNGGSKAASATASVDSPDMASSSASISKDDDASSVQNTSSETTWESKSQTSEPTLKSIDSKESKTGSDAKAKPPAVNIWTQRAQQFQSKNVPRHSVAAPETVAKKENAKLDTKGKAHSVANITQDAEQSRNAGKEWKKPATNAARGTDEARSSHFRQGSRPMWDSTSDAHKRGAFRSNDTDRQISPSSAPAPPPAANDVAWPTFESAREEDKRKAQEKEEKAEKNREIVPPAKSHGKTEWKAVPYVPSAVFETAMPARGGRAGRGSGRGGSFAARGGFQGAQGEKPAGRASSLPNGEPTPSDLPDQAKVDREAMPPPSSKPARTTNDGPTPRSIGNDLINDSVDSSSISIPQGAAASATEFVPSASYSRYTAPKGNKSPRKDGVGRRADGSNESVGRRGSVQDVNGEPVLANGEGVHTKDLPNGAPRPADGARDAQSFREPKPKRGRGGGNRGFGNAHYAASHQYPNGYPAEYASAGYGIPSSQPPFRGGHYSQNGRSSFRNHGVRSQSIALDSYGRPAAGYSGYPMPPVQTYMPEYYGVYPATAMSYQPAVEQQYTMAMVATQLEYYFSLENMVKDIYLRKHMDSQGYVFISVIAQFNRIKQLTTEYDLIRFVCLQSPNIEVRLGSDGKERLRKKEGWEKWVLPMNERDPSAQNEGPEQSCFCRGPRIFSKMDRQMMNGMPPAFYPHSAEPGFGGEATGEESRGRRVKSPYRESNISPFNGVPPLTEESAEPDNFLAEQVQGLTVVTHKHDVAQPRIAVTRGTSSRTFSNGSIDSRSIFEEMQKPEDKEAQHQANGDGATNGTPPEDVQVFWVKNRDAPVSKLPNGSTHEPYLQLHEKALGAREDAATGTCPYDMDVLYQFWSHFLIRNFNTQMYYEFCHYAKQDAAQRHNSVGLNNLLKFYEESLSSQSPIRDRIARDYIELAKSENAKSDCPAFKQLRSAWRNGALNLKNRKKLSDIMDETFRAELES